MSMEHFKLEEFSSVYDEQSKMWHNEMVYNTVERDDDHHLSYSFESYKEIVAPPPMLAFIHRKTPYRRPTPQMRFPRR